MSMDVSDCIDEACNWVLGPYYVLGAIVGRDESGYYSTDRTGKTGSG